MLVRSIREHDEFNGRIASVQSVEVRARVSGYIDRVAFRDGDDLHAGDLMFVIDQRPFKAALEIAEAQLQRTRAAALFAKAQVERAQTLIETQATPRQELDNRQTTLVQTEADVRAAEAALATARLNLTYSEVRSPISGRSGRALLTLGNLAQADQSGLSTVVSLDPIYVYFSLDESSYLRYLARAKDKLKALDPVTVALADETGFPHAGRVDFLDNRLDPATGTFRVRAALANSNKTLTPGLFARVRVEGGDPFTAMLIDDRAVLTDQDRKYVYVVGQDDKAQRKDIDIGRIAYGLRIVRSGLDANDRVVVVGTQKILSPGMPVTPVPHKSDPPTQTATAR